MGLMGGAINCSIINTRFLLSTYFLTAQTYKHMHLITRVYVSDKNSKPQCKILSQYNSLYADPLSLEGVVCKAKIKVVHVLP